MSRRTKILTMAILLMAGVAAAMVFRKQPTSVSEDEAPAAPRAVAQHDLLPPPEKPAPTSHLTGRIVSADGSSELQPQAGSAAGGTRFGLSSASPTGVGYSSLRPVDEGTSARGLAGNEGSVFGGNVPGLSYSEVRRHRIADGDTLSGLAVKYLGSADRYREIYEFNRDILSSPELLPIGTELKIPGTASAISSPAPLNGRPMVPVAPRGSASASPTAGAASGTYRVQRNDTLTGIARQVYGDSRRYRELLDANRSQLSRPEDLREGTTLVVP
jgi:nucleoid-associated protein YgaU